MDRLGNLYVSECERQLSEGEASRENAYNHDLALQAEQVQQGVGFRDWDRHDGDLVDSRGMDTRIID